MTIGIRKLGPLQRSDNAKIQTAVDYSEAMTVEDALRTAGFADSEIPYLSVQIGSEIVSRDSVLSDGDQLTVFTLMGGG